MTLTVLLKVKNSLEAEGIAIGTQSAALCLEANSDDVRQTEEYLITNTTKIVVSAEDMEQPAKVELFLYSRESTTDPIAYAALSESSAKGCITKNALICKNISAFFQIPRVLERNERTFKPKRA